MERRTQQLSYWYHLLKLSFIHRHTVVVAEVTTRLFTLDTKHYTSVAVLWCRSPDNFLKNL